MPGPKHASSGHCPGLRLELRAGFLVLPPLVKNGQALVSAPSLQTWLRANIQAAKEEAHPMALLLSQSVQAAVTKHHGRGACTQQFWRLDVQDQGDSRVG